MARIKKRCLSLAVWRSSPFARSATFAGVATIDNRFPAPRPFLSPLKTPLADRADLFGNRFSPSRIALGVIPTHTRSST